MNEISMTIGGEPVMSAASFGVENPATGEIIADGSRVFREQLDRAMRCAEEAMGAWMADAPARRAALRALADTLEASFDELASLITAEQGKPLAEARSEVRESISELEIFRRSRGAEPKSSATGATPRSALRTARSARSLR